MSIELGDRVKDKISGLKGIVTGVFHYLYGCVRICVAPEGLNDGKPHEGQIIDAAQADILKKAVVKPYVVPSPIPAAPVPTDVSRRSAGPRKDPSVRSVPTR